MFTLKLYKRMPDISSDQSDKLPPIPRHKMTKVMPVHRVVVIEIGLLGQALELWAFRNESNNDYDAYYIGEPEEGMDSFGRKDLHLGVEPGSWWGWGLLENAAGKTTEHYRPHNYG